MSIDPAQRPTLVEAKQWATERLGQLDAQIASLSSKGWIDQSPEARRELLKLGAEKMLLEARATISAQGERLERWANGIIQDSKTAMTHDAQGREGLRALLNAPQQLGASLFEGGVALASVGAQLAQLDGLHRLESAVMEDPLGTVSSLAKGVGAQFKDVYEHNGLPPPSATRRPWACPRWKPPAVSGPPPA